MGNIRLRLIGWDVLYIVLLLAMPILSIFSAAFLMIPALYLYVKLSGKQFSIHYIGCMIVLYVLSGLVYQGWMGALLISVSLFFLPVVIQMGNLYKKKAAARTVITVGTITLLAELLLSLVISYLLGFNIVARMKQFMRSFLETLPADFKTTYHLGDSDILVQVSSQILPLYLIGFSIFCVVISHVLARRSLNKSGENIPAFKRIRDWKLPKSLVWYYMIALILEHFIRDPNSALFTVLLNAVPILSFAFAVQGIAFLFYLAHRKKWNRTLPIIGIVLFIVFPPVFFILSLLGVFDVAFPIRERITSK